MRRKPERVNVVIAKRVLRGLSGDSIQRCVLQRQVRFSSARFNLTFDFLKKNGYVEKLSDRTRAPYKLTAKGKLLLECLSID